MKLSILLLIFTVLTSLASTSQAIEIRESFGSENSLKSWSTWGDGEVQLDSATKSISFSLESPGEATLYRSFDGIDSKTVEVSFDLKANRLALLDGKSFEIFYLWENGEHHFLSHTLEGSFDTTQVKFVAPVVKGRFELWFRLKSPGKIWLDNFAIKSSREKPSALTYKLKSVKGSDPFKITFDKNCASSKEESRKVILSSQNGDYSDTISSQKYYQLDTTKLMKAQLQYEDFLELPIEFNSSTAAPFFFVLSDIDSSKYWEQLNHTVTLQPGYNLVRIPLGNLLGERGSHQIRRRINLKRLKKAYFVLDPDQKGDRRASAKMGELTLYRPMKIASWEGLYSFDFTRSSSEAMPCFIPVTPYHQLSSIDQYGLSGTKRLKVADSVFADTLNRYSLDVEKAAFQVRLPNGKYQLALNTSKLGYWDTPFWKRRFIEINGKPVSLETRKSVDDYLKEYLRFENITPLVEDHPWDLYLKPIFSPLITDVQVTNGLLSIEVEGDPSAISLNSLLIWKKSDEARARVYLNELEQLQRNQYDLSQSRRKSFDYPVFKTPIFRALKTLPRLRDDQDFREYEETKTFEDELFASDQTIFTFALMLPQESKVGFKIDNNHGLGVDLYQGHYRFMSLDRNHQTYALASRQLDPLAANKPVIVPGKQPQQFYLKITSPKEIKSGVVSLNLKLSIDEKETFEIPIKLKLFADELPLVDFPVGFLGLQSIPMNYFKTSDGSDRKLREKIAHTVILELKKRGFTTFSGLPSILAADGSYDDGELAQLLSLAKASGFSKVFSYSGAFPSEILDNWGGANQVQVTPILNRFLAKRDKKVVRKYSDIVFTFSDEALGYAGTVSRDINRGKFLKSTFPKWTLGGFSQVDSEGKSFALNRYFDEGSYSHYNSKQMAKLTENGLNWGLYNQASEPTQNPRFSMGLGLYVARALGLSHLLEWHLSAFHNYPYFDLDGRENDAVMLYPTSNGELRSTLKFEQATQGLRDYRKLKWLESRGKLTPINKILLGKLQGELPSDFLSRSGSSSSFFLELRKALSQLKNL